MLDLFETDLSVVTDRVTVVGLARLVFVHELLEGDRPTGRECDLGVPSEASTGAVTLHHEQLCLARVAGLTVGEFAGERGRFQRRLPACQLLGLLGGLPRLRGLDGLRDDGAGGVGVFLEVGAHAVVHRRLDDAPNLAVAEFRLRLPLELRVGVFDGDDGRQPLADVLALEVAVDVAREALLVGVVVDDARQGGLEPGEVRAALAGVDVVGEGVNRPLQLVGGLHRHLDGYLL